jgi:hypothetical protein
MKSTKLHRFATLLTAGSAATSIPAGSGAVSVPPSTQICSERLGLACTSIPDPFGL